MNKEELIAEISKKTKVSKKDASLILSATIDSIQASVKKGHKVTLVGFGTFSSKNRAARKGRNPQTGKEIKIAAKNVPSFSAGKAFKTLLSK
jgi:DNA-binding protein HU-beta